MNNKASKLHQLRQELKRWQFKEAREVQRGPLTDESKRAKYGELVAKCRTNGWQALYIYLYIPPCSTDPHHQVLGVASQNPHWLHLVLKKNSNTYQIIFS